MSSLHSFELVRVFDSDPPCWRLIEWSKPNENGMRFIEDLKECRDYRLIRKFAKPAVLLPTELRTAQVLESRSSWNGFSLHWTRETGWYVVDKSTGRTLNWFLPTRRWIAVPTDAEIG